MSNDFEVFEHDSREYDTWRRKHPKAYVVNTPRIPTPQLMILHQADCQRIGDNETERAGRYFEDGFLRVCATDLGELRAWARDHGSADGTFTERCPLCQPATEQSQPRVG